MKAAPSKKEFEKLKNAGRVKVIAFKENHTVRKDRSVDCFLFPHLGRS